MTSAKRQFAPDDIHRSTHRRRKAFSLLELMAVVAILGIFAAIVLPRVLPPLNNTKEKADQQNRALINSAVERWYMTNGSWPADDLNDIAADPDYFPEGLPTNPQDGSAYQLDSTTKRVQ